MFWKKTSFTRLIFALCQKMYFVLKNSSDWSIFGKLASSHLELTQWRRFNYVLVGLSQPTFRRHEFRKRLPSLTQWEWDSGRCALSLLCHALRVIRVGSAHCVHLMHILGHAQTRGFLNCVGNRTCAIQSDNEYIATLLMKHWTIQNLIWTV
jgi:hypothetical protein